MVKNAVVVSHKFLTQPDDDLVIFLNSKKLENVLHVRHSFSDAPNRSSYYTWYKRGKIFKESRTRDYKGLPEPIIYLKELFFTLKWLVGSRVVFGVFVGMDGWCVLFGLLLRFMGRVKKVIYWAMDFVPEDRFESEWKNKIYHRVNISGYKNADEMWDEVPRVVESREKFLGIKKNDYRKLRIVPYGVWVDRIKKYSYEECEKNTLVFMGHLLEKQGVQLVLEAIPKIVKKIPNFQFKIIGTGHYEGELKNLAKKLNVEKYCRFTGKIEDDRELEEKIAQCCLSIAPYIKGLDTWTSYGGSGKVTKYLACGVPILLTGIAWNAKKIEDERCGMIIKEDIDDIVEKIITLMDPRTNPAYRNNALKYAQNFNYANIFGGLNL